MNYKEVNDILKSISYKPNYKFILERESYDRYRETYKLIISLKTDDSTLKEPSVTIKKDSLIILEQFQDKEQFIRYVHYELRALENHELDEFFKVDGVAVYDPHKKNI